MRVSRFFFLALLAAASVICAAAQNANSLPSAPSATIEQQAPPSAPPQQQAQQPELTHREKPGAPVLETLDPKPRPVAQPASVAPAQASPASQNASGAAEPSEQTPSAVIRSTVNEVNVVFVVTDKHNHYVKDLKADDFRVLDNKMPPASIRNFSSETNLPLRVGLLVDASNSIRDRFRCEQQPAIEFLNQIVHPSRDQAFVIGFDTTPEITQDFTGSSEKLANGVRMLRPGGGTAIYDAIYGACRDKLEKTQSTQGGLRRAIILLSDGEDNQSRVTRDDAIEEAQRAEVIVYTIST